MVGRVRVYGFKRIDFYKHRADVLGSFWGGSRSFASITAAEPYAPEHTYQNDTHRPDLDIHRTPPSYLYRLTDCEQIERGGLDPTESKFGSTRQKHLPRRERLSRCTAGIEGGSSSSLLFHTTSVCPLKLPDLLIVDRERSTTVPLFTHEIELRRRLMTTQTRHALQKIDDVVSPIPD